MSLPTFCQPTVHDFFNCKAFQGCECLVAPKLHSLKLVDGACDSKVTRSQKVLSTFSLRTCVSDNFEIMWHNGICGGVVLDLGLDEFNNQFAFPQGQNDPQLSFGHIFSLTCRADNLVECQQLIFRQIVNHSDTVKFSGRSGPPDSKGPCL